MKKLIIKTPQYQELEQKFRAWLRTLGYAEATVKSLPIYVRELLYYLEQKGKTEISEATEKDIEDFFLQWKKRKNQTTGAGLSSSHINKGITAYHRFFKYLRETGQCHLEINLPREANKIQPRVILTKKEIKLLYRAIETYPKKRNTTKPFRLRDKAILAIFYGCGLRSNEGENLEVSDILIEKKLILVRKGKGDKERYVPITENNLQDLQAYITEGRSWFLIPRQKQNQLKTEALFVNGKGNRLSSGGIYIRLKYLQEQSGINKSIGLHTLRHSIATHLLQSGMRLELISKFLGHSTLESTQIYTHIVNEF